MTLKTFNDLLKILKEYFDILKNYTQDIKVNKSKETLMKRKIVIIIVCLLIISIFVTVKYKSSKNTVLKELEISLKKDKPGKVYKKIRVNGKKINKSDLKPLIEYYKENSFKIDEIIKELNSYGKSSFFILKNEKKLFNDNYKIEIETFDAKISTNFNDSKIYVNDKFIGNGSEATSLIPGKYVIKAKLNTLYGEIIEEEEIFLVENEEYKIKLNAININLSSNFNDADVFINDKKINKKVKDIINYGPIPINSSVNLYVEREFPWGILKSEKISISDLPNININIDMVNDKLIEEVKSYINGFYYSVFDALNLRNYSLIKNSNDDVKRKIYDNLKKESLFLKNNYELSGLGIEVENSEFYFEDETYKANVVISLNYNISKKLISIVKNEMIEMFLTKMEYVNEEWQVVDVQKFSLE